MTTIYLTVLALLLAFILSSIWPPLGGIWLVLLLFGLLISIRERQMKLSADLRLIKEKLEIMDEKIVENNMSNEEVVSNEEIEQELEKHIEEEKT